MKEHEYIMVRNRVNLHIALQALEDCLFQDDSKEERELLLVIDKARKLLDHTFEEVEIEPEH